MTRNNRTPRPSRFSTSAEFGDAIYQNLMASGSEGYDTLPADERLTCKDFQQPQPDQAVGGDWAHERQIEYPLVQRNGAHLGATVARRQVQPPDQRRL